MVACSRGWLARRQSTTLSGIARTCKSGDRREASPGATSPQWWDIDFICTPKGWVKLKAIGPIGGWIKGGRKGGFQSGGGGSTPLGHIECTLTARSKRNATTNSIATCCKRSAFGGALACSFV